VTEVKWALPAVQPMNIIGAGHDSCVPKGQEYEVWVVAAPEYVCPSRGERGVGHSNPVAEGHHAANDPTNHTKRETSC